MYTESMVCANTKCGAAFTRDASLLKCNGPQHRRAFCSNLCARAQASRDYNQRKNAGKPPRAPRVHAAPRVKKKKEAVYDDDFNDVTKEILRELGRHDRRSSPARMYEFALFTPAGRQLPWAEMVSNLKLTPVNYRSKRS